MSSSQLCSKHALDGQSLSERTRKTKKSTNQPDQQTMDQQSSPQPEQLSRPGSAQQLAGESAAPITSPAARVESMLLHTTGLLQTPAVQVGLLPGPSHHKYNYLLPELLVPTFPLCLVLSLQKTDSAPVAVIRRCVTEKLQP